MKSGSLLNRVDETILVKELSSVSLLNSFFGLYDKSVWESDESLSEFFVLKIH